MNTLTPTIIQLNTLKPFASCSDEFLVPMWPENQFSEPVDPEFIHRLAITQKIAYYLMERISGETADGIILEGPTGSGKSSSLRQLLALLNYPVQSETASGNMEKEVLLGHQDMVQGNLMYTDGPLTTAGRVGHAFILEERDCAPADVNKSLNNILDGYPIHLAEAGNGARVPLAKYFFFAATQNTSAGNDFSGESPAALAQDSSSEDRFEKIYVPYMSQQEELAILVKKFGSSVQQEVLESVTKAASMVRSVYIGVQDEKPSSDLSETQQSHTCSLAISSRSLARFVRKLIRNDTLGMNGAEKITDALWSAFSKGKTTPEDALFVQEVFLSELTR